MSYKSREIGYQQNTNFLSTEEWYRKYELSSATIAVFDENRKLIIINTTRKQVYSSTDRNTITYYVVNKKKFILLSVSNIDNYTILMNMAMIYLNESGHNSGSIGKAFAIQLKELFFGMITVSSDEVQSYIDCFNKLTEFIKACYQQYPSDFLSIKQACSKQAPEDILQVLLINIVLELDLIDAEQMLQLTLLALNRNYTNIRRQMQDVTPENYNIILGLPGPLAIIFATIYKQNRNITLSIEQLMRQVLLQIQEECNGEVISTVLNNQTINSSNSTKTRSLKIINIVLSYIEDDNLPTPERVFEECIKNSKIQEKVYFSGKPLPSGFITNVLQCNGRLIDENTAQFEPKNLKEWFGIVIPINTNTCIKIFGTPRAHDSNGDTKSEANIRISDATQNITEPRPKSNRQNQGAISGRGVLFNRFQYVNHNRIAPSLKNLNVRQELVEINITIDSANNLKVKMKNEDFIMETTFKNSTRIMIAFKSITNIELVTVITQPPVVAAPVQQPSQRNSISDIISSIASTALNINQTTIVTEDTVEEEPRTLTNAASIPEPPNEYLCPITHELMENPVMIEDGFTYEREAIEEWFRSSWKSPKTGEELSSDNIIPNLTLKNLITEYKDTYNIGINFFEELPFN